MALTLGLLLLLFGSSYGSDGILGFASYYRDHMVLQKAPESAVLWGHGPEGATVSVVLEGPSKQAVTSATVTGGIWRVTLEPVEAGGPYNVTATTGGSSATLTDVLFGDIWVCGGQSNMYFNLGQVFNSDKELAFGEKYPHVRIFMAALKQSPIEIEDLIGVEIPWAVPSNKTLSRFSAVCWLFGRYMYDKLQYPIGLVESCWGGTPIEAWSSSRALQQCGLDFEPVEVPEDLGGPTNNSELWNSMIHPLLNMTIKGALWYQGERNAKYHQDQYNCSFPAMIEDWRMAFHEGSGGQTAPDFPFGFVQLSTDIKGSTDEGFPNIRWHQTADFGYVPNSRMKRTFMAVAMDLPDETSPYGTIHPRDKQDVAFRLTLGARAVAYNEKDVVFQGPFPSLLASYEIYLNITYDQKISVTPSYYTFEVCCSKSRTPCGPESDWVPSPVLRWDPVTIQLFADLCPPGEEAAAVRYAWRDWPCNFKACPVYSANLRLPAPPFLIPLR